MTVSEFAKTLEVETKYIYRWEHEGVIPLRNLVEEISVTETDKTLSDYTPLGYINKKNERIYVDKKNVLIYPSKNEICFSRFDGIFIGINAEKNLLKVLDLII
jgi:hypothetical protein